MSLKISFFAASITPGPASLSFALSVIATMLSAQAFDSRMIWDRIEEADDAARPATSSSTRPAQ